MTRQELKRIVQKSMKWQNDYMLHNQDYVDGYSELPNESHFYDTTVNTSIDLTPSKYGFKDEYELYGWLYENAHITSEVSHFTYFCNDIVGITFLHELLQEYELQIDELDEIDEDTKNWIASELAITVNGDCIISNHCPITIDIYISEKNLRMALFERYLEYNLPSGSGINGRWLIDIDSKGTVRAKNSIDYMNENGFYDGYNWFTLVLPLTDGKYKRESMRIMVHGWNYRTVKYWKSYDYQSYVEETIHDSLPIEF